MVDINCDLNSIYSNEYYDFIYNYKGDLENLIETYKPACYQVIDDKYVLIHVKRKESLEELFLMESPSEIPRPLGPYGKSSLDNSGILYFHDRPNISLRGNGVLVGIIDSGIDYTNKCFVYENNTSKIVSIWDQTIQGKPPNGFLYGTEYSNEDINNALKSENPFGVVPENDEEGHGTFLAGIAAGLEDEDNDFIGAAPDAELVVVKLKPAKEYVREYFLINEGAIVYQDTDIIMGIEYLLSVSKKFKKPISILIGLGTNFGAHDGTSVLEEFVNKACRTSQTSVNVAAGNEANKGHHFRGKFVGKNQYQNIEINVSENEKGFIFFAVANSPDEMSVSVLSPTGEYTGQFPLRRGAGEKISFILEKTELQIKYFFSQIRIGDEVVFIRFVKPTQGIWVIRIYGDLIIDGRIDAWLPRLDFINERTQFLTPNPYTTVTIPSTTFVPITVGAYNHFNSSIYIASGRGRTRDEEIKPDLVAPGVGVFGPLPNNLYGKMTGTSVSAAHSAGASALLLEWGIVLNNDPEIDNIKIKMFLIRGARRKEGLIFPNREWGYGELDLLGSFEVLKGSL